MAKAGFWAIGGAEISFRKDGNWYADEERIQNKKIAALFSKHIRRDDECQGGQATGNEVADAGQVRNDEIREDINADVNEATKWVIDIGIDRQPCRVEDTPLAVVGVDGDPLSGFTITTTDEVSETLPLSTLRTGPGNVLYCSVDRGERGILDARFLRPAYYHLAAHITDTPAGPVLKSGGSEVLLRAGDRSRAGV